MIKNLPKNRFAAIVALFISLFMPTLAKAQEAYAVEDGTTLTFYYDDQRTNRTGTVYGIDQTHSADNNHPVWASSGWGVYNDKITKVVFDSSFKNYRPLTTESWFYNCRKIATIEGVENLNTENVTHMGGMFWGCESLTELDVTGFNTANVTNMLGTFYGCSALTSLDVSGFVTDNVTIMDGMFNRCSKLSTIDVSGFNTENVTDMHNMFLYCSALEGLDLSNFNTEKVTDMHEMFLNCGALETIYCNDTWKCDVSTNMFSGCTSLKGAVSYSSSKTDVSMANPYSGYFTATVEFEAYAVEDGTTLTFYYDVQRDTRTGTVYSVTDDGRIPEWANSGQVTKVVFRAFFNYYHPSSTSRWFYNCTALETIEGIENLNTENVIDMSLMFNGCESLTSVDVSGFNTANVTEMYSMFDGCSALTALDVSGFNTANVTDMGYMFNGCAALASIDVSKLNTERVRFMESMFNGCAALTTLDVTNFATERVRYMDNMFRNCSALTTIKCDNTWTCGTSTDMFKGCTALKGAVEYDENATDVAMANPKTGYFTGEGTTAISEINADAEGGATVIYNLHGVKMHDDLQSLPAGIYIVNGKKVIVK